VGVDKIRFQICFEFESQRPIRFEIPFEHKRLINRSIGVIHKGRPQRGREGGQAKCGQKRTRGEGWFQWKRTSAFTHVSLVIWFKKWASALTAIRISNRVAQTDVTDTSCTTTPALRHQRWDCNEWDEIPLPYYDTALASHSPTDVAWSGLHGHYRRPTQP